MRRGGVAALLMVLFGALPGVPVASAQGTGAITGRVLSLGGTGVGNVCVWAEAADATTMGSGLAVTAADGAYTITGVATGNYFVKFDPRCHGPQPFAVEWFNNRRSASTADTVRVVEPLTTPGVDAVLEPAGSISGTVRSVSGTPLANICVKAHDNRWQEVVTTDGLGRYKVFTEPGRWKVEFSACQSEWATQFYNGQLDWFDASLVEVQPGADTPNINASLGRWSTISGTVTERGTGKPVSGTCVYAMPWMIGSRYDAVTDAQGRYTITKVPPGQFRVSLGSRLCGPYDWNAPSWVEQWWKDVTDVNQGTSVFTRDGDAITGINAALDRPGSISGRLTDPAGAPIQGVPILFRNLQGSGAGYISTDADGRYRIPDLTPDKYSVEFGGVGDFMTVFYKDAAFWNDATMIPVKNNVDTGGIDQVMHRGARLHGRVTDVRGNPVQASIRLVQFRSCCTISKTGSTNPDGTWELRGVRPGRYDLQISPAWESSYASEWHKDAANHGSSTPVDVVAGENAAILTEVAEKGHIAGRVTDESGHPVVGACVYAENRLDDPNVGFRAGPVKTRSDGAYDLVNIPPGPQVVRFMGCDAGNYGTEETTATVHPGLTTSAVDRTLSAGGRIKGTVSGPDNQPVQYVPVIVESTAGIVMYQYTGADGTYDFRDLAPGQWIVHFAACGSTLHGGEYYNNALTRPGASPVSVSAGGTVTASATLENGWTTPPRCRQPTPPRSLSVERKSGEAVLRWQPPEDNGNGMISSYTIRLAPSGKTLLAEGGEIRLTGPAAQLTGFAIRAGIPGMNGQEAVWGEQPPPEPPWDPPPGWDDPDPGGGGGGGGAGRGYWMVEASGRVHAFGSAPFHGHAPTGGVAAVDIEPATDKNGYWVLDELGRVYAFGSAKWLANAGAMAPGETATSLSATPDGNGYWIFTNQGRAITFGNAAFKGDMRNVPLNGPVLDSVPTPSGQGYYMVGSDGGVFAFGDAKFQGSMGGARLNAPVQSLVPDSDGTGYWLVAADGGIFSFQAPFYGSTGGWRLNRPITGMVGYPQGYLMVGEDGGIFSFGNAPFSGSLGSNPPPTPVTSVAAYG